GDDRGHRGAGHGRPSRGTGPTRLGSRGAPGPASDRTATGGRALASQVDIATRREVPGLGGHGWKGRPGKVNPTRPLGFVWRFPTGPAPPGEVSPASLPP